MTAMASPREILRSSSRARARRVLREQGRHDAQHVLVARRQGQVAGAQPDHDLGHRVVAQPERQGAGVGDDRSRRRDLGPVDREARVRQHERLSDRAQRQHRVIADPVDDPGGGVERVGALAEQHLVDHAAQHHAQGVERRSGEQSDDRENAGRGVGQAEHVEDGDEPDEQGDVDDEYEPEHDDVHDERAYVDQTGSTYAHGHGRPDGREQDRSDHHGGVPGGQEPAVADDDPRGAQGQDGPQDRQPVVLVGSVEPPPRVRDQGQREDDHHGPADRTSRWRTPCPSAPAPMTSTKQQKSTAWWRRTRG